MDSDYTCDYDWVSSDDQEVAWEELAKELDEKIDKGEDTAPWRPCWYVDEWQFVTACFTEQGCKDYIRLNGHNLTDPRIYVESGYRNYEWERLREFLMKIDELDMNLARAELHISGIKTAATDGLHFLLDKESGAIDSLRDGINEIRKVSAVLGTFYERGGQNAQRSRISNDASKRGSSGESPGKS